MGPYRLFKLVTSGVLLLLMTCLFLFDVITGDLVGAVSSAGFGCYAGLMLWEELTK